MCHNIFVVFFIALFSTLSSAAYVTKCRSADANCIRSSAVAALPAFSAGIPELNLDPMDPLHLESLDASSPGLTLMLQDMIVTGIQKCKIERMERDVAKSKLLLALLCDIDVKGKYEINGRILVLPIEGKGDAQVKLNQIHFDFDANMGEKTDKKGVKHWDIKSFNHKYELKDKAKIHMENLFNGNKELSAAVNDLFDNSANEVVGEVGPPIIKAIVTKVVKTVNHFFHKVPAEDLSID